MLIDGTLSGTTNPCQSESGSNYNEEVHYIPKTPGLEPL